MLNDFVMVTHEFDHPISIFPISDVHFGALEHKEKEWLAFCEMIQNTPNAYVILGGDLINNNIRSSVGSPWDDTIRPREQKKRMVELLTPIKDRILCCVTGNHEARSMTILEGLLTVPLWVWPTIRQSRPSITLPNRSFRLTVAPV